MVTIGQRLGEARREAGLSVEAIAHETKIHPHMIRAIEGDDFSTFPSVAYARSFVNKYAGVLGIDLSESLRALNSGVTLRIGDHELTGEMKKTIRKDRRFRRDKTPRSPRRSALKTGGRPLFLNLILIILIGAMGVFYFLGFHASSPEQAQENIAKGLQGANPFAGEEEIEEFPFASGSAAAQEKPAASRRPDPTYAEADIEKPEVKLELEKPRPLSPGASANTETPALPIRETARLSVAPSDPSGSIPTVDIPALRKVSDEPEAVLRPEGTDPVAGQKATNPATKSRPFGPLRAIPVARSR